MCNGRAAVDDLDDHIDEGLARFSIHHAHPGDPEELYFQAVLGKSIESVSVDGRTLLVEANERQVLETSIWVVLSCHQVEQLVRDDGRALKVLNGDALQLLLLERFVDHSLEVFSEPG